MSSTLLLHQHFIILKKFHIIEWNFISTLTFNVIPLTFSFHLILFFSRFCLSPCQWNQTTKKRPNAQKELCMKILSKIFTQNSFHMEVCILLFYSHVSCIVAFDTTTLLLLLLLEMWVWFLWQNILPPPTTSLYLLMMIFVWTTPKD